MESSATSQKEPALMLEMMEQLGIDPGARMAAEWSLSCLTAVHRCLDCQHKRECRAWLDDMPAAATLPPRFCPCADILFEMQVDQPGPHYGDQLGVVQ